MHSLMSLKRKETHPVSRRVCCSVRFSEPMTRSGLPTSLSRSKLSSPQRTGAIADSTSPIAADGGFGPMEDDQPEDEDNDTIDEDDHPKPAIDTNEEVGEEFDDFEAGDEVDDFGEFDDGFQESSTIESDSKEEKPSTPPVQSLSQVSPYVSKTDWTSDRASNEFCSLLLSLVQELTLSF